MAVEAKYIHNDEVPEDDDDYPFYPTNVEGHTGYELCTCPVCRRVTLRSYYWHEFMDDADVLFEILYPAAERIQNGLPPEVRKAYESAQNVRHIDPNAYGVLLGRVLDIVCEDRGASGDTLDQKLTSLHKNGEIPEKLVAVAAGVRRLRNVGAHADLGELTEEELPVLNDLTRAILDYV